MDLRRICIFGAGAIGGHLAARFAAAGHDVAAVARGANLDALRERGIALREGTAPDARTIGGRLRASDRAADLGPQDAVLVTTKATALAALAEAAPLLCHEQTFFVFVQNGVPWWYAQGIDGQGRRARPIPPDLSALDPGGALARAIAPERVVGAVVYSSNNLDAPGQITNHSARRNMLVVGEPADGDTARVRALRAALEAAGMPSPPAADIRASVWDKLLLNFGSTLCVPIGEPLRAVSDDPRLRALRDRLFAEGRAIALAHGVRVEDAPRRPGAPAGGGAQVSGASAHKPSMLQDYEQGRPMEIEAILATPCAFARAAGVEAPALEALTALTARLAARKGLYSPR
jgi:2-dehydropantoate 2-reductase